MRDKIISLIKTNRISTTEVADCMGKSGALEDVLPVNRGHFRTGPVKWVYAYQETNWDVHEQIADTREGEIVFIEAFECNNRAIIGELVAKYLLLYKQAAAIITNARFRDAGALIRENYPVWGTGVTPIGCFNQKPDPGLSDDIIKKHRKKYQDAIAVCDDSGVVIIPSSLHNEDFYSRLVAIEEQEDIWFERLDKHKENTYEIVCLKKYLSEVNARPLKKEDTRE